MSVTAVFLGSCDVSGFVLSFVEVLTPPAWCFPVGDVLLVAVSGAVNPGSGPADAEWATVSFGEPTPNTKLDVVVDGVLEAFGLAGAGCADGFGGSGGFAFGGEPDVLRVVAAGGSIKPGFGSHSASVSWLVGAGFGFGAGLLVPSTIHVQVVAMGRIDRGSGMT